MTIGEASRQYQAALESERRIRTTYSTTHSAADEIAHAVDETAAARNQIIDAMVAHLRAG